MVSLVQIDSVPPSDWPIDKSVGHFLDQRLMGESRAIGGSATLRQVIRASQEEKSQEEQASKQCSSMVSVPSCFSSHIQVHALTSCPYSPRTVRGHKPSRPQVASDHDLYHSNRDKTEQELLV